MAEAQGFLFRVSGFDPAQKSVQQTTSSAERALDAPPAKARRKPDPLVLLALFLLMQVMVMRIAATYPVFSATYDEPGYIQGGLEAYQLGTQTVANQHPPLPSLVIALFPHLSGARLTRVTGDLSASRFQVDGDYWKTLALARIGTLVFIPLLVGYVYRWSSLLWGRFAGLAACALVTFSPNVMAHASLATSDFAAAATMLAAAYHLWRWSQHASWANCLLSAAACGVAVVSKFSALVFLPAIFVAYHLIAALERWKNSTLRGRFSFPEALGQVALFCGVALAVIWAVYSFHARPSPAATGVSSETGAGMVAPQSNVSRALTKVWQSWPVLPHPFVNGLVYLANVEKKGYPGFLLGSRGNSGWWYYFLVVIAVKSTLPMLLLVALAAVALALDRTGNLRWPSAYVAGAAGSILAVALGSATNVGVRHILAIYPLLAVFVSVIFARPAPVARGRRLSIALATALLAWHAGESVLARPDYLAYFNEIARGREDRILGDSNLDWGQDQGRLARYLKAHPVPEIHVACFGPTLPETLGIQNSEPLEPGERVAGWAAVSVNELQGIYLAGPPERSYEWLRAYRPHARIGKSIYLYYLPQ